MFYTDIAMIAHAFIAARVTAKTKERLAVLPTIVGTILQVQEYD
jgi:hypothetical protein